MTNCRRLRVELERHIKHLTFVAAFRYTGNTISITAIISRLDVAITLIIIGAIPRWSIVVDVLLRISIIIGLRQIVGTAESRNFIALTIKNINLDVADIAQ